MRGPDVAKWQRFIWQEGPIENGFGARTETETKWFQQQHRLVPTGIVGPETVRGAEMLNAF
jgi:peptidoglycan hydrolase-like protein with peptidoglycan-binding domain